MPRQSDLRYTFQPLRGDPFEVVSFTLEEGLSQPFKLELELVSHHPAIDFYRMLDLAAVFTIWRTMFDCSEVGFIRMYWLKW